MVIFAPREAVPLIVKLLSAYVAPTAPLKVVLAEPAETVKERGVKVASLLTVLLNVIVLLLAVRVRSLPDKVTAPEYNCVPLVVMSAPSDAVPETERLVTPVTAPLNTALPEMVRALEPPAKVELVVTVLPCRVRVAPEPVKVTAPL